MSIVWPYRRRWGLDAQAWRFLFILRRRLVQVLHGRAGMECQCLAW